MTILLVLGGNFHTSIRQIEQHASQFLAIYARVVCFEYPQFVKLPKVVTGTLPLIEHISNNLTVFHSFGMLPGGRTFHAINRLNHAVTSQLLKITLGSSFDIVITYTPEYALIAPHIKAKKVIYHVLDDYESLPWWGLKNSSKNQLHSLEQRMLQLVDRVIAVSPELYSKYKKHHPDVRLFPTPAYLKHYRSRRSHNVPDDMKDLPRPIIGFAGSATFVGKLATDLLKILIRSYPNFSFVFTGEYNNDIQSTLEKFKNCHFLGIKSLSVLPDYIADFDVCLVPYITSRYGMAAYPVKIMEYLFFGKPVVTTALPSVEYLSKKKLIYWSRSQNEFIRNVGRAVKEEMRDKKVVEARRRESFRNDWSERIRDYIRIIKG